MTNKTYWPFDVGDFRDEIAGLTPAEVGAYLRLAMFYWDRGGLPIEAASRRLITGLGPRAWQQSLARLAARFAVDGDPAAESTWRHPRLDPLRAMVAKVSDERAKAGRAGAEARRQKAANGAPRARGQPRNGPKPLKYNGPGSANDGNPNPNPKSGASSTPLFGGAGRSGPAALGGAPDPGAVPPFRGRWPEKGPDGRWPSGATDEDIEKELAEMRRRRDGRYRQAAS